MKKSAQLPKKEESRSNITNPLMQQSSITKTKETEKKSTKKKGLFDDSDEDADFKPNKSGKKQIAAKPIIPEKSQENPVPVEEQNIFDKLLQSKVEQPKPQEAQPKLQEAQPKLQETQQKPVVTEPKKDLF